MATQMLNPAAVVFHSCCWLEIFSQGTNAAHYAAQAKQVDAMRVPVVTLYEVYKFFNRFQSNAAANIAVGYMRRGEVIDIDTAQVLSAASNGLPFAHSLIYASAQAHKAELWTQDAHLNGLPGVRYFAKA